MDRYTMQSIQKLGITQRSDEELHSALTNFELKWQTKARRAYDDDERLSHF